MKKSEPKVSREHVRNVLLNCTTPEQIESAMNYVRLSGYANDKIMREWRIFKNQIESI
jgi:hypothetical protein